MLQGLKNLYHLLTAVGAVAFFRFPTRKLSVVGVTGTDGKTTTVHLIGQILKKAGLKVAIVSSVGAWLGEKEIDTGFHVTTPDSWSLQRLLRQIVNLGFTHVVLEATSHGLDQHRLWGCNFQIGVVTNVTHEHLDYHKTWERYLAAKAKLFNGVKVAVLNRDDNSYSYIISRITSHVSHTITYGLDKADLTPKAFPFKTKLPGEYNVYNCLAAVGVGKALGIKDEIIRKAIENFSGVIGRMEEVDEGQDFEVIVDFAHTPNALEKVLQFLKTKKSKNTRLIAVFGCAGLRDIQKRPMMGEISARLADISVFTAEDPRTEDINQIIEQMTQGALKGGAKELDPSSSHSFFRISDRGEAIKFAIQKLSRKGDIIVICGKGHERSMCYGTTEYPWSDQDEARKALKELKKMLKQIDGFYQLSSLVEQKNLIHGFSGRALGDMKIEKKREKFLGLLNLDHRDLALMEQIHGHKVKVVRGGDKGKILEGVDGLVTNKRGLVLGIKVADCLPVLLFDPQQRIIALAHAGWKGVTSGIVPNVLREMVKMGADPKDVLVGIGPHIGGCCFTAFADRVKIFRRKFGDLSGMIYKELDEFHLDLVTPVVFQLKNDGVRPENIDIALTCTSCQNEKFFSFRKEKTPQRMLGIIGLIN